MASEDSSREDCSAIVSKKLDRHLTKKSFLLIVRTERIVTAIHVTEPNDQV